MPSCLVGSCAPLTSRELCAYMSLIVHSFIRSLTHSLPRGSGWGVEGQNRRGTRAFTWHPTSHVCYSVSPSQAWGRACARSCFVPVTRQRPSAWPRPPLTRASSHRAGRSARAASSPARTARMEGFRLPPAAPAPKRRARRPCPALCTWGGPEDFWGGRLALWRPGHMAPGRSPEETTSTRLSCCSCHRSPSVVGSERGAQGREAAGAPRAGSGMGFVRWRCNVPLEKAAEVRSSTRCSVHCASSINIPTNSLAFVLKGRCRHARTHARGAKLRWQREKQLHSLVPESWFPSTKKKKKEHMQSVWRDHLWVTSHPPKMCAKDWDGRSLGVCPRSTLVIVAIQRVAMCHGPRHEQSLLTLPWVLDLFFI